MSSNVSVKHEGKRWKIYYYSIDSFEYDLTKFGDFLESVEERGEEVSSIIPNMGFVKTSIVLGTSFQGVKGFAVIAKIRGEREGWICPNCGIRTYALPYADDPAHYRCPYCEHHFRRQDDGSFKRWDEWMYYKPTRGEI